MRLYWLIPLILIISLAVIWNIPVEKFSETLPVVIAVSEPGQIGVHTTKEPEKMFDFGATFPGTKVQKFMNLTRGNKPPARVHITISGETRNWISVNKNDFILNEPVQVEVVILIPEDAERRAYNGNIKIYYISTYGMRLMQAVYEPVK